MRTEARRFTILLAIALPVSLNAQAPVWLWATGLYSSTAVQMKDIASSSSNGCFAYGSFSTNLFLPFNTLENAAVLGNHFVVHVDTLGYPTWAAQFSNEVVSMQGLPDDGLSCLLIYQGAASVNGQVVVGSVSGYSALIAEFDQYSVLQNLVNIPGLLENTGTQLPDLHHDHEGGIVVSVAIQDSVSVLGNWLHEGTVALARISPEGELVWAQALSDTLATAHGVLHMAGSGHVLAYARRPDVDEAELISFNPDGEMAWHQPIIFGGPGSSTILPVLTQRSNGNALIGIAARSQAPGGGTYLSVEEYDGDGDPVHVTYTSGPSTWNNEFRSISATSNGGALVSGLLVGSLTLGSIQVNTNGPDGFIASIDSLGNWQWVVTETSGNVVGTSMAPGTNSRIYTTGNTDTGVWFGSHHVPTNMGNFTGFVACLGDIQLGATDLSSVRKGYSPWPNPATNVLYFPFDMDPAQGISVTDLWGRPVGNRVDRISPRSFDVSRLAPGTYVISVGGSHYPFMKE